MPDLDSGRAVCPARDRPIDCCPHLYVWAERLEFAADGNCQGLTNFGCVGNPVVRSETVWLLIGFDGGGDPSPQRKEDADVDGRPVGWRPSLVFFSECYNRSNWRDWSGSSACQHSEFTTGIFCSFHLTETSCDFLRKRDGDGAGGRAVGLSLSTVLPVLGRCRPSQPNY